MTKESVLPDFRNLGILLRALLAAQVLALAAALIATSGLGEAIWTFLDNTAYFEPPLLSTLLFLLLAMPWLARMPLRGAYAATLAMAVASALLWNSLLALRYTDLSTGGELRASLLTAGAAGLILSWFDWRARRLSPALAEARLHALQARIRPHFLFNSLNSVLSLIRNEPGKAELALENLAELYRALLADNRQLSTLARELELTRAYLDLEALRLGDRLSVTWRTENAPSEALLPGLMLQPLLENAVYHGVEPHPEGGHIGVDIFAKSDQLHVVVRNPYRPEVPRRAGNRMALSNIRERLALHFDVEARLSTYKSGDEFVVQVAIPLKEAGRA